MGLCGASHVIEKGNINTSISKESNISKTSDIINQVKKSQFNNNDNNNTKLNLVFKAIIGEQEYPIYITKKSKIEICILPGDSSLWSFIPNEELTDFRGHNDYQYKNLNIGCLLIRISSTQKYFSMTNNKMTFTAMESGSLIISANLDPNNYLVYEPRGSINLSISGGKLVNSSNTIDELTGYKFINSDNIVNVNNSSLACKEIARYINKARHNIKKYMNDFMIDYNDNDLKLQKKDELPLYHFDNQLYNVAEEHCQDLCKNGTFGHIGTDGSSVKNRLQKNNINIKDFGESIIYGLINPILIVNFLIADKYSKNKENRSNILNKNFSKIGISLNKHFSYGYCCVILFG
jgi:uncharacterized protein YkwD